MEHIHKRPDRGADIGCMKMNCFFCLDLKRSLVNKGFLAGLLFASVLLLYNAVACSPLDGSRSTYFILANVYGTSGFMPFAAIFPVMAYSTAFCEERSSGYLRMILSRMSIRRFAWTRICTVALSGGIMLAIPFSTVSVIAYAGGAHGLPAGSDEGLFYGTKMIEYIVRYGDWYILVGKVLLGFLFGAMWALVGLAFSVWIPNRYVGLIGPFVLYDAMWLCLASVPVLDPIYLVRGDDLGSYPLSAFMEAVYICATFPVIFAGIRRAANA